MQRQYITKNSNNNSSTNTQKSPLARTAITQTGTNTNAPLTQQDIENQQYQQDRFEATKLEIQAKYGTITPLGQERLNLLQAKKAEFWQRYLGNTLHRGHDFSQIPVRRQDASPIQAIQPKLTIGEPGDKYEQEADRVAAQVVNQINAPVTQQSNENLQHEYPAVQRNTRPWLKLQAKDGGMAAPAELESSIQQARSSGQPLADNVRKPMEHAFGTDFSGVKVHTDTQADQLNQSIQARAFTTGQDVFFRQGEYNPGSRGGQELIAHELTHVVQQNGEAIQCVLDSNVNLPMVLRGQQFQTPDINGAMTTMTFKLNKKSVDRRAYGLMFTDYFRYGNQEGLKYHFTVTLAISRWNQNDRNYKIEYNNPHLTVRTDVNAAAGAATPGLHISCINRQIWSGNDDQINQQDLPSQEEAMYVWVKFTESLVNFIGPPVQWEENANLIG